MVLAPMIKYINFNMKRIEDYINVNEGKDAFKNLDPDLYSLICKLLGQFIQGKVDIPQKDNKQLVKDAKVLLFNLG